MEQFAKLITDVEVEEPEDIESKEGHRGCYPVGDDAFQSLLCYVQVRVSHFRCSYGLITVISPSSSILTILLGDFLSFFSLAYETT